MKDLKIFPKMFLQIFSVLGTIIIFIHLFVFLIFPKTYLETRKDDIDRKANEISRNLTGKEKASVQEALEFYSKTSEIKAFIQEKSDQDEIQIGKEIQIDPKSDNNSLIIEEREVVLNTGEKIPVQFISTADMQKEAKELTLQFLPYSLSLSVLFSVAASLIYAKSIRNNIQEIKEVTDKMMKLDKNARLLVDSKNEVGQLKEQINDLYSTLLKSIDQLEQKNQEILRLEQRKYDFLRGASHELKTPLSSLKIILENMKYKIGKYKNRDLYLDDCLGLVDELTQNISQILTVSSLEHLKDDEEVILIKDVLSGVLEKYGVLVNQKEIRINNHVSDEKIYIGKTALKIILSNLIGNAVKYTDYRGVINIGADGGWLLIENSYTGKEELDMEKILDVKFDSSKENSNGLGLYIVGNLLNNYKIPYRAEQKEQSFLFKIKLHQSA